MKEELIRKYEKLTITNDFIFGKVMEDLELCREVVSRIVGFDVGTLDDASIQVSLKETIDGRGIRLDSLTKGFPNNKYNSEMQIQEDKAAGKRIRYYQGNLDIISLQKGDEYTELPDVYMIYICCHDPVGDGRCKHEFVYTSKENPEMVLEDGSHRIIINVLGNNVEDVSPELKELIDYIRDGICESDFIERVHERVCQVRVSRKCREDYMRYTLEREMLAKAQREEGREAGREEGREEQRVKSEKELDAQRLESEKELDAQRLESARTIRDMLLELGLEKDIIHSKIKLKVNISKEELDKLMGEI